MMIYLVIISACAWLWRLALFPFTRLPALASRVPETAAAASATSTTRESASEMSAKSTSSITERAATPPPPEHIRSGDFFDETSDRYFNDFDREYYMVSNLFLLVIVP